MPDCGGLVGPSKSTFLEGMPISGTVMKITQKAVDAVFAIYGVVTGLMIVLTVVQFFFWVGNGGDTGQEPYRPPPSFDSLFPYWWFPTLLVLIGLGVVLWWASEIASNRGTRHGV